MPFPSLITKLFPLLGDIVDRVIPDPQARAEAKLEMMRLAQEGQFRELELELEEERLYASDRASARAMQQEVQDPVVRYVSLGFLFGYFVILTVMFFANIPNDSQTVLNVLLGALAGGVVQILNFYFGSSKGSKAKDDAIIAVVRNGRGKEKEQVVESSQLRPLPPKPPTP